MKSYSYFLTGMLAIGLTLVACNKEQNAVVEQPAEADQTPVGFGAYVNRPITKAGFFSSNLTIDQLKDPTLEDVYDQNTGALTDAAGAGGFGVFAYYTNADNYDQTFTPNFMYNQPLNWVEYNAQQGTFSHWDYSPVKYWPNEFGRNAQSDDADKISFFAYAPYVSVNPASGKVNGNGQAPLFACDNGSVTEGIVGMKRNNATGDPMIQYKVSAFTDQQVDLLWGVVGTAAATATTIDWNRKNDAADPQKLEIGLPFLNIEHPKATSSRPQGTDWNNVQKVNYYFLHALASLNVTVDTKTNSTSVAGTTEMIPEDPTANPPIPEHKATKVFIRSVTFEGFDTKGALNLNNAEAGKALWYNFDCNNELNNGAEFTIYDGRKDGKEGLTAATKEYAAINPELVQNIDFAHSKPGADGTPRNLFARDDSTEPTSTEPILVIPNGDKLKVTIEYDVLTEDASLSGMLNDGVTPGSVVKNVITRYITTNEQGSTTAGDMILANGKTYTIKLHLGLNSVEFDANVTDWGANTSGGADLPHNN